MDVATGWQIATTLITGLAIIITMKNDIAQLKRETEKQEQKLEAIQKQQARQATRLAVMENLHNV